MPESQQLPPSENMQRSGPPKGKSPRRIFAALCLAASAIAVVFLIFQLEPGSANGNLLARMDHSLPSLAVEDSKGAVDLKTFVSGTRSVIVFYSPSCETCKKVLPALQPFPDTLRLILVNESPDAGAPELSQFHSAAQFCDRRGILSRSFAAAALPTILFVDEAGILRDGIFGFYGREFVQRKLKNFAVHSNDRTLKNQ
jgi:thiol-disulfide isomerase/thioredoxin